MTYVTVILYNKVASLCLEVYLRTHFTEGDSG